MRIEEMTNEELKELKNKIAQIEKDRKNKEMQKRLTELRQFIEENEADGFCFYIIDGFGGSRTIYAKDIYCETF